MPSNITGAETEGQKWAILQAWVKQACVNAGIAITGLTDPLLSDINGGESEGIKLAKLQRWIRLLAENVTGGGGGSGGPTVYTVTYTANDQSVDVAVGRNSVIVINNPDNYTGVSWQPTGTREVGDIFTAVDASSPLTINTQVWNGLGWDRLAIPEGQLQNYPVSINSVAGVVTVPRDGIALSQNFLINVTEPITSILTPFLGFGSHPIFTFVQDATGGHSVSIPANWHPVGGVAPVIDTRPNAATVVDLSQSDFMFHYVNARSVAHRVQPVLVTGTRDLAAADGDRYLYTTTGSAVSLTVQANTLPLDAEIDLFQAGAGQITLVAGSGVTIVSKGGNLKLSAQGSAATLKHITANVWHLVGDLSA